MNRLPFRIATLRPSSAPAPSFPHSSFSPCSSPPSCLGGACSHHEAEPPRAAVTPLLRPPLTPLFDDLERRTFNYFWETANPDTGLIPDRYPYAEPFSSIAAIGFALTAYAIGVERGYVTRAQARAAHARDAALPRRRAAGLARRRHDRLPRILLSLPRSQDRRALRGRVELSTVDTALLLGGVLFAQSYFDRKTRRGSEIRAPRRRDLPRASTGRGCRCARR